MGRVIPTGRRRPSTAGNCAWATYASSAGPTPRSARIAGKMARARKAPSGAAFVQERVDALEEPALDVGQDRVAQGVEHDGGPAQPDFDPIVNHLHDPLPLHLTGSDDACRDAWSSVACVEISWRRASSSIVRRALCTARPACPASAASNSSASGRSRRPCASRSRSGPPVLPGTSRGRRVGERRRKRCRTGATRRPCALRQGGRR